MKFTTKYTYSRDNDNFGETVLKRRWYSDGGLNGGTTFVQIYANHQYNHHKSGYLNNAWYSLLEMKIKPITCNV